MCRPASSPPPSTPAPTGCRRSPTSSRCCGRARSSSPATATTARRPRAMSPPVAASGLPVTPSRRGRSSSNRRAGRCSISCAPAASRASVSTGHPAAVAAAGALVHYLRGTQKADLAHVRSIAYRQRADALLDRSDDAQASRDRRGIGRRPRRVAARRARSHGHLDGQPAAARVAAPAAGRARADPRSAGRGRRARVSHHRARQVSRHDQGGAGSRAPGRARRARHRRAARPRRAEAVARGGPAAAHGRSPSCRRRCVQSLVAELDDLADVRDTIDQTLIDDPPALARDGGFTRDGVDPELDELRDDQPLGQAGDRRDGGARARAHRHRVAEGPLQPRVRLLHRDLEVEPARGAGRLPPQADHRRRRALHHAGAEGIRGEGARRRRADPRARARDLRAAARRRSRPRRRASRPPRAPSPALDVLAALAETAAVNNYIKPHVHDGDELAVVDARHPVVERRTRRPATPFVPNDITLERGRPASW